MSYKIEIYPEARDQIGVLPAELAVALAEAMAMLALTPWNGLPYNDDNPDGNLRVLLFGAGNHGKITYLILENQRRVDLLKVMWLD